MFSSGIKLVLIISISAAAAFAQTTSFVYQGKLQDTGVAANGSYQFQFKLFDAAVGGNQIGLSIEGSATVTTGIFAVNLHFGGGAFISRQLRFWEVGVRMNGS